MPAINIACNQPGDVIVVTGSPSFSDVSVVTDTTKAWKARTSAGTNAAAASTYLPTPVVGVAVVPDGVIGDGGSPGDCSLASVYLAYKAGSTLSPSALLTNQVSDSAGPSASAASRQRSPGPSCQVSSRATVPPPGT